MEELAIASSLVMLSSRNRNSQNINPKLILWPRQGSLAAESRQKSESDSFGLGRVVQSMSLQKTTESPGTNLGNDLLSSSLLENCDTSGVESSDKSIKLNLHESNAD